MHTSHTHTYNFYVVSINSTIIDQLMRTISAYISNFGPFSEWFSTVTSSWRQNNLFGDFFQRSLGQKFELFIDNWPFSCTSHTVHTHKQKPSSNINDDHRTTYTNVNKDIFMHSFMGATHTCTHTRTSSLFIPFWTYFHSRVRSFVLFSKKS